MFPVQGTALVAATARSKVEFDETSDENIQLSDFWDWAGQYKPLPEINIL